MKIKNYFFILIILLTKHEFNLCAEGQENKLFLGQREGEPGVQEDEELLNNFVGSVIVEVVGDVIVLSEVVDINSNDPRLETLKKELLKNNNHIKFKQNQLAIHVAFEKKNIKAKMFNLEYKNFNLNNIDLFKLKFLPIDLFFQFEHRACDGCKFTVNEIIYFQFNQIENGIQFIYEVNLNVRFLPGDFKIIEDNRDKIRFKENFCCGYYYDSDNCFDCLCCWLNLGCCIPSCPFKNGKCPTKSGNCVIL